MKIKGSKLVACVILISLVPAPLLAQITQALDWGKERAVSEAEAAVLRQIGESVGLGSPIYLNQNHSFPRVDDPVNFHPILLKPTISDLKKTLPPGDYSLQVTGYCTHLSMHAPGKGLAYKLAPLEGKQAKAVGALFVRGTLRHVSSGSLQGIAWNIEAGAPLSSMGDGTRALIHELIPEYESSLEGDFLANIESTYDKYRLLPNMPTLETLLGKSAEGQYVLNVRRDRQVLADKTIAAENIPDRLYQPTGDGLPRVLPSATNPQASPWSEIRPGVIARFTIQQGYAATNLFEFRISKSTSQSFRSAPPMKQRFQLASFSPQDPASVLVLPAEGWSVAEILGFCVAEPAVCAAVVAIGVLIAYSVSAPAQPLTIMPVLQQEGTPPQALPNTSTGTKTRTCSDDVYQNLKGEQDQACSLSMSCSGPSHNEMKIPSGDNQAYCAVVSTNIDRIKACYAARKEVMDKCFGGGDPGHAIDLVNLESAQAFCEANYWRYCGK